MFDTTCSVYWTFLHCINSLTICLILDKTVVYNYRNVDDLIINNATWYENFNIVPFLSSVGRHFRMGAMLSRERYGSIYAQ